MNQGAFAGAAVDVPTMAFAADYQSVNLLSDAFFHVGVLLQFLGGHHPDTLTHSIQDGTQMTLTLKLNNPSCITSAPRIFLPTSLAHE